MADSPPTPSLSGLEQLLKAAGETKTPPVEKWNPSHCGDIGLAIGRDGTWTYQNSPIGRQAMVKLFSSVLRRDEDGQTYLVTPVEKITVHVEDAHFIATEMDVSARGEPSQTLYFKTNVGDVVEAGKDHPLTFRQQPGGGLKPYIHIRGRLEALVSRAVTYDLLELVEGDPGNLVIRRADQAFSVPDPASG